MFKVRHTACDNEVLVNCREMEAKKNTARVDKISKHVDKYLDKLDKREGLMAGGKELQSFNGVELKIVCNIRRLKSDGPMPSRVAELRLFANHLAIRDPIEVKEYIMDQGTFSEDLVASVLQANEDPMIGLDPDTYDVKDDMNMDSFEFEREHDIDVDVDVGGQFLGV